VLDRHRIHMERQAKPVGVHHYVMPASFDILARITAARAAALRGLGALAVDHRCGRTGPAPGPLAVVHNQVVV
jgi:hypothetical protein